MGSESRRRRRYRRGPRRVVQSDLQGNILCGYGNDFGLGLYAFVRVNEPEAGRAFLRELADRVTNAVPWLSESEPTPWYRVAKGQTVKPESTLNVAITWEGLRALEVPTEVLEEFPVEFQRGMHHPDRAKFLGDVGASDPANWDPGLHGDAHHVLVTIFARSGEEFDARRQELAERVDRDPCLAMAHEVVAGVIRDPGGGDVLREHFGFADGLSQPTIRDPKAGPHNRKGRGTPKRLRGWDDLAPGEFVLGYADEDGTPPPAPPAPYGDNGSYMVVRKLRQHVDVFTRYLREASGGDANEEEHLAAKMVGRHRDGRPLVRPDADGPDALNAFRFRGDKQGELCPVGSHIRRANPRDGFGFGGRLTKRHRIIRRGMPYGPPPAGDPAIPDGVDRGLIFVCFQADIKRQFEVVQGHWLNDGEGFGLGSDKDFLVSTEETEGKMTIPMGNGAAPRFLSPQPSLVTTRGGGYYFAPGLNALRAIARSG